MMKKINNNLLMLLIMLIGVSMWACEEDESYPRTRLFKPVLNRGLYAEANTIIVNMGDAKEAVSYTVEVSRDSFETVLYTLETDTNYLEINAALVGEELYWNAIYQVRATAHADAEEYDSKISDFGSVRTQRFPSNMYIPESYDVVDFAARPRWLRTGAPITGAKVFDVNDLRLENPLSSYEVTEEEEAEGMKIIPGLEPLSTYQIAIYSEDEVRGWANFTTVAEELDPSDPNIIDLTESEDADAVINAVASAASGNIILVKKGVTYNMPKDGLNKSITIQGDLGFGEQKAVLYSSSWTLEEGATVDYARFIDLEIEGKDIGGSYVFNANMSGRTVLSELTFDGCEIHNLRGMVRIRGDMFITDYNIRNSVVHHIGVGSKSYGLISCDTDGEGKAAVDNVTLENSTFGYIIHGIITRQNTKSVTVDGCTFYNFPKTGQQIFRYRGPEGFDQSLNGIQISNSIFGHAYDEDETGSYAINAIDGLNETIIDVTNVYATSGFEMSEGDEILGLPSTTYGGTFEDLWVEADSLNFNFKDLSFSGRTDAGDPRWRTEF